MRLTRNWWIFVCCLAMAVISGLICIYITVELRHIPKGFSAAPNPPLMALIQWAISLLTTGTFSLSSVVVLLINLWQGSHTIPVPVPPKPSDPSNPTVLVVDPTHPEPPNNLQVEFLELMDAFPAWIRDTTNKAKSLRFWLAVCLFGIEWTPDPEIKKWLQDGAALIVRKYFPPTAIPVDGQV